MPRGRPAVEQRGLSCCGRGRGKCVRGPRRVGNREHPHANRVQHPAQHCRAQVRVSVAHGRRLGALRLLSTCELPRDHASHRLSVRGGAASNAAAAVAAAAVAAHRPVCDAVDWRSQWRRQLQLGAGAGLLRERRWHARKHPQRAGAGRGAGCHRCRPERLQECVARRLPRGCRGRQQGSLLLGHRAIVWRPVYAVGIGRHTRLVPGIGRGRASRRLRAVGGHPAESERPHNVRRHSVGRGKPRTRRKSRWLAVATVHPNEARGLHGRRKPAADAATTDAAAAVAAAAGL